MAGFWGVSRAIEPLDSNGLSQNPVKHSTVPKANNSNAFE